VEVIDDDRAHPGRKLGDGCLRGACRRSHGVRQFSSLADGIVRDGIVRDGIV
jgi:hypothetical protein